MYVRLVISEYHERSGQPSGLFRASGCLEDRGAFTEEQAARLRQVLRWFNRYLHAPRRLCDPRAVFWFKADAREMTEQVWELAYLLWEVGAEVRLIHSDDPGVIVYDDRHQVAAVPYRRERPRPAGRPARRQGGPHLDSATAWRRFIRDSKSAYASAAQWWR